MDTRLVVMDPFSENKVRYTDNGPKEGDYISATWQFDEPVELGPDGKPFFMASYPGDGSPAPVEEDLIEEDTEDDDS